MGETFGGLAPCVQIVSHALGGTAFWELLKSVLRGCPEPCRADGMFAPSPAPFQPFHAPLYAEIHCLEQKV
jgi:hypothetical protein